MPNFRLFAVILALACLITACSPTKRLSRLLKKHPYLVNTDTIFRKDTVITKEVLSDTVFYFNTRDTVIMRKDNLEVKYYFRSDSTVYLEGKCKSDTIIREIPFIVNKVEATPKTWFEQFKEQGFWILLVVLATLLCWQYLHKNYVRK